MAKPLRKPGDPKVAVAYLRVSTEDQKLDAQRDAINTWATREGVQIAAWMQDDGVSGASEMDERPGLVAAISALQPHNAGLLVIVKRDRLARDVYIAMGIERAVEACGARVVTADGTANSGSDVDAFMRTILDAVAQYERAMIRGRTKAALQAKKKRNERTGTVRFGFHTLPKFDPSNKKEPVRLEEDPHEQKILARARALAIDGCTSGQIAHTLANEGFFTRNGVPFRATHIGRLVADELAAGRLIAAGRATANEPPRKRAKHTRRRVKKRNFTRKIDGSDREVTFDLHAIARGERHPRWPEDLEEVADWLDTGDVALRVVSLGAESKVEAYERHNALKHAAVPLVQTLTDAPVNGSENSTCGYTGGWADIRAGNVLVEVGLVRSNKLSAAMLSGLTMILLPYPREEELLAYIFTPVDMTRGLKAEEERRWTNNACEGLF